MFISWWIFRNALLVRKHLNFAARAVFGELFLFFARPNSLSVPHLDHHPLRLQIKKTSEATLTTIQDMVTIEDYDVSECFHHSRSTESVKSTVSETYLSKPSIAKRRANQQETEQFYFMVSGDVF